MDDLDFKLDPDSLKYGDRVLVACVVQDVASGAFLMLAWADREAVAKTQEFWGGGDFADGFPEEQ